MSDGIVILRTTHDTEEEAIDDALNRFLDDDQLDALAAEADELGYGEVRIPHCDHFFDKRLCKWAADVYLICEEA